MARHPHLQCCFLLLLCLVPVSSMAKDFWAIDCGATESTMDDENRTWEADGSYVHCGVSRTVNNSKNVATYGTLRAFEAEKPAKGCYIIPVGKGKKVHATAWFYYGNYDGLGQPPTFQLQFDANEWDVVKTSMGNRTLHQAIYVTRRNSTSICVSRGSTGETPFITTIYLAVLGEGMYGAVNSSRALFNLRRVAFGATDDPAVDRYYRIWSKTTPAWGISDYTILNNEATSVDEVPEDVPPAVFQTAITPRTSAPSNLTIRTPSLRSTPVPIYFTMYFTEPADPEAEGRSIGDRAFRIFMDGQPLMADGSGGVIPPYGAAVGYSAAGHMAMGSNTTVFDLVPTETATLPPVISALELFRIGDLLSNGTDSRDVDGLSSLQDKFEALQAWAGDPCLPTNYNWEWVTCSSGAASPRITKLDLSGFGLSGILPDFSSMDALQAIDLSNNSLTGSVPEFLANLPDLQKLNLADNDFTSIPSSLVHKSSIQLDVSGNPKLPCMGMACSPAPAHMPVKQESSAKKNNMGAIVTILCVCIMHVVTALAR